MSQENTTVDQAIHEKWSSRSAFLMAAVGAAVGLGNIWRLPNITGDNGGGSNLDCWCRY